MVRPFGGILRGRKLLMHFTEIAIFQCHTTNFPYKQWPARAGRKKKTAKDSSTVQKANIVSLVTASLTDKSCKKRPSEAFPGLFQPWNV